MFKIMIIPENEFIRIWNSSLEKREKWILISDMCRANALASVKRAGSGHLGSSLSSLDIVTLLYYSEMNTITTGIDNPDRDIYFSSKGHDAPGHYAVLFSLGVIPKDMFINLRRLGGTHGHPDIRVPGIEANSGSLGMGISKAKGMAFSKKINGNKGRIFVMTGDGELQEGQIWEALQTTAHQKINNIYVIVDSNKIQSDKPVHEIIDLGDLCKKFELFGWHVERVDGHDFKKLDQVFSRLRAVTDKPKALIADTVKGKGISFMEGETALKNGNGLYKWHSGAPDDDSFEKGFAELIERININFSRNGLKPLAMDEIETRERHRKKLKDTAEKVVSAYEEALFEIGGIRKDIVVLDADLSADCGLRKFENAFPERFIENGIAEQDMVSMAGGLALQGFLPIVNSFGVFLSSRANEQIYNNSTENTKIIYVCHYAGLIPAGPGHSHQSIRDISLFGALPNCVSIEPCNAIETKSALEWCVYESKENCHLRLIISPSPETIELPDSYRFTFGRGTVLTEGKDVLIFGYGPVMLHEALSAGEILKKRNITAKIVNMPWLNRSDLNWFQKTVDEFDILFVLDNHSPYGGLGDFLLNITNELYSQKKKKVVKIAVTGLPACGNPQEVLKHHQLDGNSLASRVLLKLGIADTI